MKELDDIQKLLSQIAKKKIDMHNLSVKVNGLNFNGHQDNVSVAIGDVKIDCSYLDHSTGYASRMKPGCDMIVLGMKKLLNAKIWAIESEIKSMEQQVKRLVSSLQV